MAAKPLRTTLKRASAERCWRSLGATSAMVTPTARPHIVSVRGVLLHRCLRKGNAERPVFTGFYPSPGIVGQWRPCLHLLSAVVRRYDRHQAVAVAILE